MIFAQETDQFSVCSVLLVIAFIVVALKKMGQTFGEFDQGGQIKSAARGGILKTMRSWFGK